MGLFESWLGSTGWQFLTRRLAVSVIQIQRHRVQPHRRRGADLGGDFGDDDDVASLCAAAKCFRPGTAIALGLHSTRSVRRVAGFGSLGHMRTHLYCFVAVAFTVLVVSCNIPSSRPSVDIDIRNDSTNDLNWVSVLWDEGKQTAGVLRHGASSVSLDAGLPKKPKSDTAFMEFVDDSDGWIYQGRPTSERKRYRIPVDVSALKRLSAGHYRVTFSILSFTEARLQIQKKEK